MKKITMVYILILLGSSCHGLPSIRHNENPNGSPNDSSLTSPKPYFRAVEYNEIESTSFYLTMSDRIRIAVTLHLPRSLEPGKKIPALLHQTRYWRSLGIKFPAKWFVNGHFVMGGKIKKYFVQRGYAWIDVDVRGTGASFGRWKHSYWEREVRDGAEVVNWIINQPWSNGSVGAWGLSYAGGAAEFLLVNQHPNVKAAVPMYSPFDVYDDIGFPGGIFANWYVEQWARLNEKLDQNKLPVSSLKAKLAVSGVRPVDGKDGKRLLQEALEKRTDNTDVLKEAEHIVFRDDSSPNISSIDRFSPHAFAEEIIASGVPIYSYSGWYDGAYQHAAIKRFLTYDHPGSKLIIGPWDHGGRHQVSPFVQTQSVFDHNAEMLKFFDQYLKDIDTGIRNEPKVHYYTMGEERWKAADSWPPQDTEMVTYYFSSSGKLQRQSTPNQGTGSDLYPVDFQVGTGQTTRWTALVGAADDPVLYPNWASQIEKAYHYTSSALEEAMQVTGHPLVTLYISSSATDGNFFVYLEDVSPDGKVNYVTEGMLRALHRNSIVNPPPYRDVVPVRLYDRHSAEALVPGKVVELVFDLLPTSYQFQKGHAIRVSIAGADKDYFKHVPDKEPQFRIYRSEVHPSHIELPVVH